MNKKEQSLSDNTVSFRPTKGEYFFLKGKAQEFRTSISNLMTTVARYFDYDTIKEGDNPGEIIVVNEKNYPENIIEQEIPEKQNDVISNRQNNLNNVAGIQALKMIEGYEAQIEKLETENEMLRAEKEKRPEENEKLEKKVREDILNEIMATCIVISTCPELKTVINIIAEHNIKEGRIKYSYELLHILIKSEI